MSASCVAGPQACALNEWTHMICLLNDDNDSPYLETASFADLQKSLKAIATARINYVQDAANVLYS